MNDGDRDEERPEDLQQRIRELAYLMWEAGGRQHGRALEYWLEAERRIYAMLESATRRLIGNDEASAQPPPGEAKGPESPPEKP